MKFIFDFLGLVLAGLCAICVVTVGSLWMAALYTFIALATIVASGLRRLRWLYDTKLFKAARRFYDERVAPLCS
jgi:hypothetical protein